MLRFLYLLIFTQITLNATAQYVGGAGDGFDVIEVLNSRTLFQGGGADGFGHVALEGASLKTYQGQDADGFSQVTFENVALKLYRGKDADGFAYGNLFEKYIWTGAVGTGWNVDDNWNTQRPPALRHQAIIPAGVPNFPFINAGILSVGKNLNDGLFTCGELLIRQNAELTTRINCFVENYGRLEIRGVMTVLNKDVKTFRNFSGSILEIGTNGSLMFN